MPPTASIRQVLTGRVLHIAALAGLLAPLGACEPCVPKNELGGVAVNGVVDFCSPGPDYSDHDAGSQFDVPLEGIVRNDASGRIVVDSCHPNDTCAPMESIITLSGTDLSLSIPDGTFVQLHLRTAGAVGEFVCTWHVKVRNLPTWGGTPNPTSDGNFLWLAHFHTLDGVLSEGDDPHQTELESFCQTGGIETYAFRFSFPDAPGAEVFAPPGQTVTWSVPAGEHAGEYRVRNLQAMYDPGEYEGSAGYNYWIAWKSWPIFGR